MPRLPLFGLTGLVQIRISTFMALVEDVAVSLATAGFKRIVFLNGHYDNTYAIAYACANAADKLPRGVMAFPINYWDGMSAEEAAEYTSLAKGMHANAAETAAILAINPDLRRPDGTWGDATTATPEMGERFLSLGVKSTLAVLENIEKPSRPCRRADHRRGVPDTVCVVEA